MRIAICTRKPFSEHCETLLRPALIELGILNSEIVRLDSEHLYGTERVEQQRLSVDYVLAWRPPARFCDIVNVQGAVFSLGAGVEHLLTLGIPRHIPIVKLEDAGMSEQIADYVMAAVLRFHIGMETYRRQQMKKEWQRSRRFAKSAVAVGVLGIGSVGSRIATSLSHCGFQVRGFSRMQRKLSGVTCFHGEVGRSHTIDPNSDFSHFLTGLQVLVSALPATEETTGILGRSVFEKLAPGAHLINVGRGTHLNEADFLSAIASGRIASATLDVFEHEPLPRDHPFWNYNSVIITPHIAANLDTARAISQIATKIRALAHGEDIPGIVSREHQY